jgi:UDP-glucose 4-epimerase
MDVAVTGGSGFIGSHVVDRCVAEGWRVRVVDAHAAQRDDVEHRAVDVLDVDGLVDATRGCDAVFHLAAVANVNDVVVSPVDAVRVNVTGTAAVWEAARRNGIGRAVLASTVWVYGAAPGSGEVDESAAFDLRSAGHLYTSSKLAAELVAHSYHELYGQPFTILRYGVPFGPRMRDELVIARFVRAALAGEPLRITGDGSQARNYVYIDDLADAHVRALAPAGENQVVNLEGPEPVSIRRIAETVRALVGSCGAIEYGPARPGDFAGRPVSSAAAARLLGWVPRVSFDDGLARYLDWYRERDGR